MRNSTIVAMSLAALAAMPMSAETVTPLKLMKDAKARVMGKMPLKEKKAATGLRSPQMRLSEQAKKIKPTTTKTYGWNGDAWVPEDLYTYTYDAAGNVTVELCKDPEDYYSRTVNEYNENNMVVSKDVTTSSDGVNFSGYRKSTFEYDPILTSVITKRTESIFFGGEWRPEANNYRRIINRDEEGNITSVVIAVLYNDEYDPTDRLTVTYGEDGTATEISEEVLDYDGRDFFWVQGARIYDITWDRTDGQIWDVESIYSGNNRIKSGVYDEDGMEIQFTLDYAEEGDGYFMTMTIDELDIPMKVTSEYTPLENDGVLVETKNIYMDVVELMTEVYELRYDDWGLLTLEANTVSSYDGEGYYEKVIGEVEYDAEGRPEVYTVREEAVDYGDDQVYEDYIIKAEYSDYEDVTTGVEGVEAAASESLYYDLQGMPVSSPEKGRIVIKDRKAVVGCKR